MIRRKLKKKSAKLSKIIFLIFVVFIVLATFLLIRFNPFTIKQIAIQNGISCANEDQIKNSLGLYGQNLVLLNKKKLTKNLKDKFICLKDVNFSFFFPNKIVIEVVRREPAAILVNLKEKDATSSSLLESIATPSAQETIGNFVVDVEGVIFSKETEELNIPKVYYVVTNLIYTQDSNLSLGKDLKGDSIKNSLKILERIKTFGIENSETWIIDNFFIINGIQKIIFRLDERIDIQLASLQLILAEAKIDLKELEFIDLRFDKPIVKYTPKKDG